MSVFMGRMFRIALLNRRIGGGYHYRRRFASYGSRGAFVENSADVAADDGVCVGGFSFGEREGERERQAEIAEFESEKKRLYKRKHVVFQLNLRRLFLFIVR